jgi:thiol-disulfide isomerase/thioredoxin
MATPTATCRWLVAIASALFFLAPAFASGPKVYVVKPDGTVQGEFLRPGLAQCLAKKGFVFYGASWCPYCASQKAAFGDDAENLPYVECSADGLRRSGQRAVCDKKGIRGYPTWVYPDGSRHSSQTIGELVRASGCPDPRDEH